MRTEKSVKNLISVVFFSIVIGVLGFIKVKVFVPGLTDDVYSINQLFYQIFGYLTIADIGFGLILNKNFYEAFARDDKELINKIYSTSRKFYNYIGIIMISISLVLSFFVHYLTKANLSSSYIQIVFIIFIFRNVLDYFFVAPRYVIDADQKNYKINHLLKLIKILEILSEIILVLLKVDYLIVLIPGIFITLLLDLYINHKVYKEYPFLHNDKSFDKKYLKGTKDLISLKLSGLMNSNTDIILISTFVNPITVIIYTSYVYITKFISDTIYVAASAITPSFANVINKDGRDKAFNVFKELNIFFIFIACFVSIMLYGFLNSLIVLWIGKEYLTTNIALILFIVICFYNIADRGVAITINSKGLFKETKVAMLVGALLNLVISVCLIFKLGLVGVLLGTVISNYLTIFIWNSYYIYKNVFDKKVIHYYLTYFKGLIITGVFMYLINLININASTVSSFIVNVLIYSVIVFIAIFIVYFIMFKDFRSLLVRGKELFLRRFRHEEN